MANYILPGNVDAVYESLRADLAPHSHFGIAPISNTIIKYWSNVPEKHIYTSDYMAQTGVRTSPIVVSSHQHNRNLLRSALTGQRVEQSRVSIDDEVLKAMKPEVRETLLGRLQPTSPTIQ